MQAFEEIQRILKTKPRGNVLIQIVVPAQKEPQLLSGLTGLLKTAQLENPKLSGQLIEVEDGIDAQAIIEKLKENRLCPGDNHVRYWKNKRYVVEWKEFVVAPGDVSIPWKDQGVYLITGGSGGLGLIFVKEIVQKARDVVVKSSWVDPR